MCLIAICGIGYLLTACNLVTETAPPTRAQVVIPSAQVQVSDNAVPDTTPSPTLSDDTYDALPVMQGICFEAAWDAAGTVFIFRNSADHIRFYDLADHSQLCRQAVTRYPFDFERGDILAGLWNRGQGCTARHDVIDYQRDDRARTIVIALQFVTEGDCSYDLVRGFWLGIQQASDYELTITVNP